jgi:hypothetical protein
VLEGIEVEVSISVPYNSSSSFFFFFFFLNLLRKFHNISNRVAVFQTVFSSGIYTTIYFLTDAVQERLNLWLLKTQNFLNEVTSPLVKPGQSRKPDPGNAFDPQDMGDIFVAEQTIHSTTPNGILSLAAIVSIEQFSRLIF